ncbi:MAG: HD domain-containing protein [Nanoarchaeota archaeon]|nr:HD domain-containing protein [Nanoarchaeota archaeon]
MNKPLYTLVKIDVMDTYILADIFDDEKYTILEESDDVVSLVKLAIGGFQAENPKITSYKQWLDEAEDGGFEFVVISGGKELFRASTLLIDPVIPAALFLALEYHSGQIRKGDDHPYLEHPLEVAHILWKNKFPNEVIAAGFCHDLLEDTSCKEDKIKDVCGDEVLRIVKAVSNDEALSDKKDWELKKAKYVESVRLGGEKAIAVSVADKISNLYSFFAQYEKEGPTLWKKFNRGKDKKVWFEKEVIKMAKETWDNPLLSTLESLEHKLEELPE